MTGMRWNTCCVGSCKSDMIKARLFPPYSESAPFGMSWITYIYTLRFTIPWLVEWLIQKPFRQPFPCLLVIPELIIHAALKQVCYFNHPMFHLPSKCAARISVWSTYSHFTYIKCKRPAMFFGGTLGYFEPCKTTDLWTLHLLRSAAPVHGRSNIAGVEATGGGDERNSEQFRSLASYVHPATSMSITSSGKDEWRRCAKREEAPADENLTLMLGHF